MILPGRNTCVPRLAWHILLLLGLAGAGCSGDEGEVFAPWPEVITCESRAPSAAVGDWTRYEVDAEKMGAAFVSVGDLNGDGRLDIVASSFGVLDVGESDVVMKPGTVDAYLQGDGLDCWMKVPVVTQRSGIYFPNHTSLDDVDGDGDLDVTLPGGFFACKYAKKPGANCGVLLWLENQGGPWVQHEIVPFGSAWFYHSAIWRDFDDDGTLDLITCGEKTADGQAVWFKGDEAAPGRLQPEPLVIGKGGGSLPRVVDVDGDGDLDVVSPEYFVTFGNEEDRASFVWFERTAEPSAEEPAGVWTRHKIDSEHGRTVMFDEASDLYGDGVRRFVGTNHTNTNGDDPVPESAVLVFEVPDDPTGPWPCEQVSEGIQSRPTEGLAFQAAPGLFGCGDIDGDEDQDIAVAGDGDQRTFWLEQTAPGTFATHVVEDSLGQASGAIVVDLDGDDQNELVFSGYEDNVVYVYER